MGSDTQSITSQLKPVALGLVFAILTICFGEAIGMSVGVAEHSIEGWISQQITDHPNNPDLLTKSPEQIEKKSFRYVLRGHFHGTGIGAMSVGLILALGLSWVSARWKMVFSLGVGIGGLLYPVCWLVAGLLMPSIGKTAAKATVDPIVFPAIGMQLMSMLAILLIWGLSVRSDNGTPDGWDVLKR